MSRRRWIFAVVVAVILLGRLITVYGYSVPAVDGRQYLALADEVRQHGRFAFSAREPSTYSRLPGYPLFLSLVASGASNPVRSACVANVFCDLVTALLIGWLAKKHFDERVAAAVVVAILTAPLLIVLASHALTETSATTLGVCELAIALFAALSGSLPLAALAGLFAGLGQLWRADAMTVVPAAVLALLLSEQTRRVRLRQVALFSLVALAVYLPWPVRNLSAFGRAYPFAWQWRTARGKPLPTGVVEWARTWTRGHVSEYGLDPIFAFEQNLPSPLSIPWAASDDAERAQLQRTVERYNRERLSEAVDSEFVALATLRRTQHPLLVASLPFRRIPAVLRTVPSGELSINAPLFGLIGKRYWVAVYDVVIYLLALAGLVLLLRKNRRLGLPLLTVVVLRIFLIAATVPLGLSQRHLVEVFPWLIFCAVFAAGIGMRAIANRRRPADAPAPSSL